MKGISVIICCFNSADRLPRTLKYLSQQKLSMDVPWEVIVVNNASTDLTVTVANTEWAKYELPLVKFSIINEDTPGLSNARTKGVNSAQFEYIVFCDDDNWLREDYISIAYQLLNENHNFAAVGGQSDFTSDIDFVPDWFEKYKENYAVGKQNKESGLITDRFFLHGAGLAIRRQNYLEAFEGFPSLLKGRNGEKMSCGEDIELCMRLMTMGFDLYYSEDLNFTHFIPKQRLTSEYLNKLLGGINESQKTWDKFKVVLKIKLMSNSDREVLFLKSVLRLLFLKLVNSNRWSLTHEVRQIFLTKGFKFGYIDNDYLLIKNWSISVKARN